MMDEIFGCFETSMKKGHRASVLKRGMGDSYYVLIGNQAFWWTGILRSTKIINFQK